MEFGTSGGIDPGYLAIQVAVRLPVIAVLVTGVVLLMLRRTAVTGRGGGLALSGLVVLLAAVAVGIVWSAYLPVFVDGSASANQVGLVSALVGGLTTVLDAVGLGLLLAGLLVLVRQLAAARGTGR
ncbi:hypothetical protein O7608_11250 [Solwaraspora sp. WMMA2056]|uniref:hypothetical protein n=1 Tax=Solwaraspora sp. WMMA2056 TaxID=3015161 RepID=UPI00259AFF5A|nr:hypothetical protein [Solwaraspora sp. WMMA2056]WJK42908.1 hypothetical protein O7608_11250 [Solwaraspora sp. WMMA2056]